MKQIPDTNYLVQYIYISTVYVCAFVCVYNYVCLHAFLIKSSVIVYEMLVADDEFLSAK